MSKVRVEIPNKVKNILKITEDVTLTKNDTKIEITQAGITLTLVDHFAGGVKVKNISGGVAYITNSQGVNGVAIFNLPSEMQGVFTSSGNGYFLRDLKDAEARDYIEIQSNKEIQQLFPHNLLIKDFRGNDILRFMLDIETGNDKNNGQSWAKAKKTITGIMSEIPNDLQGYEVSILIKAGSIIDDTVLQKTNGGVSLHWVGASLIAKDSAYTQWLLNGETLTLTDNPITWRGNNSLVSFHAISSISILSVRFQSADLSLAEHETDWGFGGMHVFEHANTDTALDTALVVALEKVYYEFNCNPIFNLGSSRVGLAIHNDCRLKLPHAEFYGGDGDASTSVSTWRGALYHYHIHGTLVQYGSEGSYSFNAGFEPKINRGFYIEDVKQLITFVGDASTVLMQLTGGYQYVDNNYAYGKSQIQFSSGCHGYLVMYEAGVCDIVESSDTGFRIVKEFTSGDINNYLSNKLVDDGTNLIYDGVPVTSN